MPTVKQSPASVKMNGEMPHFHSNYLKELPSLKKIQKLLKEKKNMKTNLWVTYLSPKQNLDLEAKSEHWDLCGNASFCSSELNSALIFGFTINYNASTLS